MNVDIETKKAEAVARMEKMGIFPQTIQQFRDEGLVSRSEAPFGACYWISDEEKKIVKEFEEEYNALVYMTMRTNTTIGLMDTMFYVSDHKEEWDDDRELLENHETYAYVYNYDSPECSEIGMVGFQLGAAAGLLRTY